MTKFEHAKLKKDLLEIYRKYSHNPDKNSIIKRAREIHTKYSNAMPLLNKDMQHAVNLLVDLGWNTGIPKPTKKTIKEIIKKIK